MTVITHVVHWEVLFFFTSKAAFSALPSYGLDSFRRKFWEAMGEEISIHMAFFVWHLKIALPSFCGIPTNASIIFSTFRGTNSRSSDLKCKFVPSNLPQGVSCLILNFPRAFVAPPPQTILYSPHKRSIVMWSTQPGVTYFFKRTIISLKRRLRWNIPSRLFKSKLPWFSLKKYFRVFGTSLYIAVAFLSYCAFK